MNVFRYIILVCGAALDIGLILFGIVGIFTFLDDPYPSVPIAMVVSWTIGAVVLFGLTIWGFYRTAKGKRWPVMYPSAGSTREQRPPKPIPPCPHEKQGAPRLFRRAVSPVNLHRTADLHRPVTPRRLADCLRTAHSSQPAGRQKTWERNRAARPVRPQERA